MTVDFDQTCVTVVNLHPHGEPTFETAFSGRDLILLAGGLFLLWKATKEIHHNMDTEQDSGDILDKTRGAVTLTFGWRRGCRTRWLRGCGAKVWSLRTPWWVPPPQGTTASPSRCGAAQAAQA